MSDFTYQNQDSSVPLERYEWDRTWLERTENISSPRVLYVGDSISWGIRPEAQKILGSEILIDALATSKALDNPWFLPTLDLLLRQGRAPGMILVNNGLHGWHLEDEREYADLLKGFLLELKKRIPRCILLLTTGVEDLARNQRVILRNQAARAVAAALECPVVDLYTPAISCRHTDGVHFDVAGYRALAQVLVTELRALEL